MARDAEHAYSFFRCVMAEYLYLVLHDVKLSLIT